MQDAADFELQKTEPTAEFPSPRPPSSLTPWIVAAVIVVAAAAAYFYMRREPAPVQTAAVTQTDVPVTDPERPLGTPVEPVEVPPLDQSDAFVRDLVRKLSSHPRVAAWLTTNGLIRNFTGAVENISTGRTPANRLRVLRPEGSFAVVDGRGGVMIDTRSYNRYNDLAAAVDSVDAAGAAKLYSILKPRIEEAYRDLGHATPFDRALATAIVHLLETPAVEGDVALVPRGALFTYNDPRLERLSPAQKQLMRMGPRNVRTIQRKLREIGLALGLSAEQLPRVAR